MTDTKDLEWLDAWFRNMLWDLGIFDKLDHADHINVKAQIKARLQTVEVESRIDELERMLPKEVKHVSKEIKIECANGHISRRSYQDTEEEVEEARGDVKDYPFCPSCGAKLEVVEFEEEWQTIQTVDEEQIKDRLANLTSERDKKQTIKANGEQDG